MQQRPPPNPKAPHAGTDAGAKSTAPECTHSREVTQVVEQQSARVRRVLRSRGVAERDLPDAEQEVFLVVHRKLAEFEGRSSLPTWLHRIAINVASEHRRKARHRYESLAGDITPEPSAADPEAQLEARDALQRVRFALEALSAEQRETFLLHEIVGLSMHEVAAQLHVPLKTAFSRFYAARRGLLAALARRGIASVLWAWLALALSSRLASRARALAPKMARVSLRSAQLPLAGVVLICSVLPPLAPTRMSANAFNRAASTPERALAPAQARIEHPAHVAASTRATAPPPPRERMASHPAHRTPRAATVAVEPLETPPQSEPQRLAPTEEADIIVTRAGAEDLRPEIEPPLAAYVTPRRASARIQLGGPREAANALEESLADSRLP